MPRKTAKPTNDKALLKALDKQAKLSEQVVKKSASIVDILAAVALGNRKCDRVPAWTAADQARFDAYVKEQNHSEMAIIEAMKLWPDVYVKFQLMPKKS